MAKAAAHLAVQWAYPDSDAGVDNVALWELIMAGAGPEHIVWRTTAQSEQIDT